MDPLELLASAYDLVSKSPNEAELRRAVSGAYYALFHKICLSAADEFAGSRTDQNEQIWCLVYRALQHGDAKKRCSKLRGRTDVLAEIANTFNELQEKRHDADYNPKASGHSPRDVINILDQSREAIWRITRLSLDERKEFLIRLLFAERT